MSDPPHSPPPTGPPQPAPWERERIARDEARRQREENYRRQMEEQQRQMRRRIAAENAEQAELMCLILSGDVRPHEIDVRLLQGDRAKETLLVAKRIWDVLFQFRLDGLAHDALEFLGGVMRDEDASEKSRVDAAKTILAARAKVAVKVNNPGEAAVRALIGGMGGGAKAGTNLRDLDDGELLEGFKRLLIAATDQGD